MLDPQWEWRKEGKLYRRPGPVMPALQRKGPTSLYREIPQISITVSQPSCAGRIDGEQDRPERQQNTQRDYRKWFGKGFPNQRQHGEDSVVTMKRLSKTKEMRLQVSSHLNNCTLQFPSRLPQEPLNYQ